MAKMDPRIYKTLQHIDKALLDNLQEASFHKVTIESLCRSAMINRSTFYKYYSDKYALLDDFLTRALEEFRAAAKADFVEADPSNVDDPYYTSLFRDCARFLFQNKERYLTLWNASVGRNIYCEMVDAARDCILDKLSEGREEPVSRYEQLYAMCFASNMLTLIRWWFQHEREVTEDEVVEIMSNNMKRGLFCTFKQYL